MPDTALGKIVLAGYEQKYGGVREVRDIHIESACFIHLGVGQRSGSSASLVPWVQNDARISNRTNSVWARLRPVRQVMLDERCKLCHLIEMAPKFHGSSFRLVTLYDAKDKLNGMPSAISYGSEPPLPKKYAHLVLGYGRRDGLVLLEYFSCVSLPAHRAGPNRKCFSYSGLCTMGFSMRRESNTFLDTRSSRGSYSNGHPAGT